MRSPVDVAAVRRRLSRRVPPTVREVVSEAIDDDVARLAAATAFFAVLSLFPTLVLLAGLVGVVDGLVEADLDEQVRNRLTSGLDAILTDRASGVVTSVETFLAEGQGGLFTTAALASLLSVSGAWGAVVSALNKAYDTGEDRPWLRRRALGLGLGLTTILLVVLTAALLVAGPLLGRGREIAGLIGLGDLFVLLWTYLRWPFVAVVLLGWLAVVYRYGPNRRTRWRTGLPGAVLTTVAWLAATAGFHVYLRLAGTTNPVLGAYGGAAILMIWVYLLTIALLLGGELNSVLAGRSGRPEPEEKETA